MLDKINRDVGALLADKDFIAQSLTPQALLPGGDSRREFGERIKTDTERWADAVNRANIKL